MINKMYNYMITHKTFPLGYQQRPQYHRHRFQAENNEAAIIYAKDYFYGEKKAGIDYHLTNSQGMAVSDIDENWFQTPLFDDILRFHHSLQWWKRKRREELENGISVEFVEQQIAELKLLIQKNSSIIRRYKPKY